MAWEAFLRYTVEGPPVNRMSGELSASSSDLRVGLVFTTGLTTVPGLEGEECPLLEEDNSAQPVRPDRKPRASDNLLDVIRNIYLVRKKH